MDNSATPAIAVDCRLWCQTFNIPANRTTWRMVVVAAMLDGWRWGRFTTLCAELEFASAVCVKMKVLPPVVVFFLFFFFFIFAQYYSFIQYINTSTTTTRVGRHLQPTSWTQMTPPRWLAAHSWAGPSHNRLSTRRDDYYLATTRRLAASHKDFPNSQYVIKIRVYFARGKKQRSIEKVGT